MCDTPLGSNPPNTFRFSCNQIIFKNRFVGREVPVPVTRQVVSRYIKPENVHVGTSLFANRF